MNEKTNSLLQKKRSKFWLVRELNPKYINEKKSANKKTVIDNWEKYKLLGPNWMVTSEPLIIIIIIVVVVNIFMDREIVRKTYTHNSELERERDWAEKTFYETNKLSNWRMRKQRIEREKKVKHLVQAHSVITAKIIW